MAEFFLSTVVSFVIALLIDITLGGLIVLGIIKLKDIIKNRKRKKKNGTDSN